MYLPDSSLKNAWSTVISLSFSNLVFQIVALGPFPTFWSTLLEEIPQCVKLDEVRNAGVQPILALSLTGPPEMPRPK